LLFAFFPAELSRHSLSAADPWNDPPPSRAPMN
jgi:hypothetical protein